MLWGRAAGLGTKTGGLGNVGRNSGRGWTLGLTTRLPGGLGGSGRSQCNPHRDVWTTTAGEALPLRLDVGLEDAPLATEAA